ncbi:MAG: hypothetical protein ABSE73_07685 [Planctomycetota bacterium]
MLFRIALPGLLAAALAAGAEAPVPKEGALVPKAQAAEVRGRILALKDEKVFAGIRDEAAKAVAEWPKAKAEIEPHAGELLDVLFEANLPKGVAPAAAIPAAKLLDHFLKGCSAKLGFMFFLTGEQKYADTAFEILDLAGRVPRWGWFNWEGANMPQIHYGMYARSAAFCVDFCWSGWDKERQKRAAQVLAERVVEPYWRLVSLPPFMAFHHLRSRNQGSNALGGALVGAIVLGDSVPENKLWFGSLLQTLSWIIAHDIGWAGTNLESGLPGYWDISMSNLYTAAACLNNAKGIDLRSHPAFAEATWYPVMKEATVPFAPAPFEKPYPKNAAGLWGIIQHKPLELPSEGYGGPWWYDYAAQFPDSPAAYFVTKKFGQTSNPHQEGHFELMDLLWVRTMHKPEQPPLPTALFKATDREAMFRSGYGSPHTFLSFNGDFFLSARNEVLCCTSGLAWHFPWQLYAVTESALETEGQPFSPSMLVTDSFDSRFVSMIAAKSWTGNAKYYAKQEQTDSYKSYKERTRDILYVRSPRPGQVYDYFIFVDRVAHDGAKWHSFNWHIWNRKGNEGKYEIIDSHTVLARRPNAAVLLSTLSHNAMTYEQQGIPSQPTPRYSFDHDVLLLRAFPGAMTPAKEEVRKLPVAQWSAGEAVEADGKPARHFVGFKALKPTLKCPLTLTPGMRYRMSVQSKKFNAWVDENVLYALDLTLLDAQGNAIRKLQPDERGPDPQRLSDPASATMGATSWQEAATYFDAPPGVAAATAELRFAQHTNNGRGIMPGSELWISDVEIAAAGTPERREKEFLVTLAMPLENDSPRPEISSVLKDGRVEAKVTLPYGTKDFITVFEGGRVDIWRAVNGPPRVEIHTERMGFGWQTTKLSFGDLTAATPFHAAMWSQGLKLGGALALAHATEVSLFAKKQALEAGVYLLNGEFKRGPAADVYLLDGEFKRDPAAVSLKTNSEASQKALKAGLASVAEEVLAARDKYTKQGWKNIALEATATASGVRDPRFGPEHVNDNQTSEMPTDGVLDYTLGDIQTTGNGGYGKGKTPYTENMTTWPFFIRPTYWLLPYRQPGSVTLKLKEPSKLRLVRLLNTTNAGLNDYATVDFLVELLNADGAVAWSKAGSFGQVQDGAFASAFVRPNFFKAYSETFQGMLEPGAKVPFGTGWQEIEVAHPDPVQAVRVTVQSFWGLGGGLNEVQVYP